MMNNIKKTIRATRGFTLVELMIALAISGILLLGVVGTYSSISATIQASQELENAQEVIRYSGTVFTRSLKQVESTASVNVTNAGNTLTVSLPANATSCLGTNPVAAFIEMYDFVAPNLTCSINGAPEIRLLTGMADMNFSTNGDLVSIQVTPLVLRADFGGSVNIDVALTTAILRANI
ncbi:prepilin-type N-terminal cleavage/methylation domain-containing protein [Colwellia sp. D2M02]|uniref:prepilin-type N-terminal cleavage/methylation domain-containing protein n=1 Tax=Colwellia sp. D2M02 TaxID=2841562 RepID=UPI001C09DFBC|nr:prepilin-type N-terminal cleavage/methylation domain-containing protein [Colwellia sp. D2M02]MBU2892690.1 prepilin-type N-terminal cleavage/methylation domain-containing protein [Colwellia sp. D2M02]